MAEDPKANNIVGEHAKDIKGTGRQSCKEVIGEPSAQPFPETKWICPRRRERSRNLTNVAWNLGGTFQGTFWQARTMPTRTCPREAKTPKNLETLVEPWWSLGGALAEPSAEPLEGKTDLGDRSRDTTKLGEPWWSLWWNLWWNLGGTWWKPWRHLAAGLAPQLALLAAKYLNIQRRHWAP